MTTTNNRVQTEGRSIPHRCPICATVPGSYSGKLVFPGEEAPLCDNHAKALKQERLTPAQVTMVPVPA